MAIVAKTRPSLVYKSYRFQSIKKDGMGQACGNDRLGKLKGDAGKMQKKCAANQPWGDGR